MSAQGVALGVGAAGAEWLCLGHDATTSRTATTAAILMAVVIARRNEIATPVTTWLEPGSSRCSRASVQPGVAGVVSRLVSGLPHQPGIAPFRSGPFRRMAAPRSRVV